jgi:hypothetical protein
MGDFSTAVVDGVVPTDVWQWPLRAEDWRRAKAVSANLLVVGATGAVVDFIEALRPDLHQPVVVWRAGERFAPPTADCAVGTMILKGVDTLTSLDQQRLYQWLQRRASDTQVVSISASALLPLVESGLFHDGLYYRLNTVCVEFDGVVPAEERPSWLRGRPAARDVDGADGSRSLASTAWSLRVKPDRRQSIVVMPIRRDRRGR